MNAKRGLFLILVAVIIIFVLSVITNCVADTEVNLLIHGDFSKGLTTRKYVNIVTGKKWVFTVPAGWEGGPNYRQGLMGIKDSFVSKMSNVELSIEKKGLDNILVAKVKTKGYMFLYSNLIKPVPLDDLVLQCEIWVSSKPGVKMALDDVTLPAFRDVTVGFLIKYDKYYFIVTKGSPTLSTNDFTGVLPLPNAKAEYRGEKYSVVLTQIPVLNIPTNMEPKKWNTIKLTGKEITTRILNEGNIVFVEGGREKTIQNLNDVVKRAKAVSVVVIATNIFKDEPFIIKIKNVKALTERGQTSTSISSIPLILIIITLPFMRSKKKNKLVVVFITIILLLPALALPVKAATLYKYTPPYYSGTSYTEKEGSEYYTYAFTGFDKNSGEIIIDHRSSEGGKTKGYAALDLANVCEYPVYELKGHYTDLLDEGASITFAFEAKYNGAINVQDVASASLSIYIVIWGLIATEYGAYWSKILTVKKGTYGPVGEIQETIQYAHVYEAPYTTYYTMSAKYYVETSTETSPLGDTVPNIALVTMADKEDYDPIKILWMGFSY